MVENIIEKISFYIVDNLLYKDEQISEENREVMLFGVTRIIEDIPKYLAIIIIGIAFNIINYIAIVFAINILYKTFIGGAHAQNNVACFFSSIIVYTLPVLIAINVEFNILSLVILAAATMISGLYVIIKIAPADTEEIPILKKYRRNRMKILATISLILIMAITFLVIKVSNVQEIILLSTLEVNLLATNIAYKLYGCKHSYESEEFKEFFNT